MKMHESQRIHLIDRSFTVTCSESQKQSLKQVESYLNSKMKSIRASGKVVGFERTLLMTCLNITHQFLQTEAGKAELDCSTHEIHDRIGQ